VCVNERAQPQKEIPVGDVDNRKHLLKLQRGFVTCANL